MEFHVLSPANCTGVPAGTEDAAQAERRRKFLVAEVVVDINLMLPRFIYKPGDTFRIEVSAVMWDDVAKVFRDAGWDVPEKKTAWDLLSISNRVPMTIIAPLLTDLK